MIFETVLIDGHLELSQNRTTGAYHLEKREDDERGIKWSLDTLDRTEALEAFERERTK